MKADLWADSQVRAREVWMLISETLLHPHTMQLSGEMFRPEKYLVGATRSFVTIAEAFAMATGRADGLSTVTVLREAEEPLGFDGGNLVDAFQRATTLRVKVEQEGYTHEIEAEYARLGEIVLDTPVTNRLTSGLASSLGLCQQDSCAATTDRFSGMT